MSSRPSQLAPGRVVVWNGLAGVVEDFDGDRVRVRFDDGETLLFNAGEAPLEAVLFGVGDLVERGDGARGVVIEVMPDATGACRVQFPDGQSVLPDGALRPAVDDDPVSRARSASWGSARSFNARAVAEEYWLANRYSPLVALSQSRVDLMPHQVFVAHRVADDYPHRFMLCDEVGLGKTIEAGILIKELRARGQAARVLVLVPAGLQRQWQFELKTKFNETFAIYNSSTLRHLSQNVDATSPWTEHPSVIVSHSWASHTEQRRHEIASVPWDMVIVDEAHHARSRRSGQKTTYTNLYRLVAGLIATPEAARRAVLLLTASPMQLDRQELYSMVEMLNPTLFTSEKDFTSHLEDLGALNAAVRGLEERGVPADKVERGELEDILAASLGMSAERARVLVHKNQDKPLRLAEALKTKHRLSEVLIRNRKVVVGGFQPRRAVRWEVELSALERRAHDLAEQLVGRGLAAADEIRGSQGAVVGFQMVILQKLLASSSRALLRSLRRRRESLAAPDRGASRSAADLELRLAEDNAAEEIAGAASAPWESRAEMDELIAALEAIDVDSKAMVLRRNLVTLFLESAQRGDHDPKVLIFTEFRETQSMLADLLSEIAEVSVFHGQQSPQEKDRAVETFRSQTGPQVLVSTEAGGEGRNFQFCHVVVNYDLPWNPMKVEQRIGRVDRIGQQHPVLVFNFHVAGTIEGRILDVLERRIKLFEQAVGGLDPILGEAEADIKRALRAAEEDRESMLERVGARLEEEIRAAREAEEKLSDLILDSKSYSASIAQKVRGEASPIEPAEFEHLILGLLRDANTYVSRKDQGAQPLPEGVWYIHFHPPFTLDHGDVVGEFEARRVLFDPRQAVDSEMVEYFGFGHPVVDRIVGNARTNPEGASAVRAIPESAAPISTPGWQFNFVVSITGLKPNGFVYPVFVPDGGDADEAAGDALHRLSRRLAPEESSHAPDVQGLDRAKTVAEARAGERLNAALAEARGYAERVGDQQERRLNALFARKTQHAEDRREQCERTLTRLAASASDDDRRVIPLWEANMSRAEAELQRLESDRQLQLRELKQRLHPSGEWSLLNLARVEVV